MVTFRGFSGPGWALRVSGRAPEEVVGISGAPLKGSIKATRVPLKASFKGYYKGYYKDLV